MIRLVTASAGVYKRLLVFCPRDLREEYGNEMTLVFADDLADSLDRGGPTAALRACLHAAAELAHLAVSNALSVDGVFTAMIAGALTMTCFTAELAVARAHGPTPVSTAPAYVSLVIVLIPGLAAALVAFIAARLNLGAEPQHFLR